MMSSTLKLSAVIIAMVLLTGCNSAPMQKTQSAWNNYRECKIARSRPSQGKFDAVMPDPAPDEAAAVRQWEPMLYQYPNGATLAYPTYNLNVEDRRGWTTNDVYYSMAAPLIVVWNTITMPFNMIIEPPNTAVAYHGVHLPPTQTLAPPLQ